jgi:outer membrane protein
MELGQRLERDQQQKKNKLEEESASVAEELVKEVRRKVATYGEENNYVYIYGSNETANILYAKEGKDITEELIEYINK